MVQVLLLSISLRYPSSAELHLVYSKSYENNSKNYLI